MDDVDNFDVIVVGCGLSGVVMAERFASKEKKRVLIIDKREHIGGNCYDYIDEKTGIRMNKYGAHLFHTNDKGVYDYVNKFTEWTSWYHKVVSKVGNKYVPIPVNIETVNKLTSENIENEDEAKKWFYNHKKNCKKNIINSEDIARSRVGDELYEKLFKSYTYKQWGKMPEELDPEVLGRIPINPTFNNNYFKDKYQILPKNGYTDFFKKILEKHEELITVRLGVSYETIKDDLTDKHIIIFTGPIDHYFGDLGLEKLEYRSIKFTIEHKMGVDYYQQNSVVNYADMEIPYTRCIEYKHFLDQESEHTVIVKEESTDTGEPYYPVLNNKNKTLYNKYRELALKEKQNIHFIGRLANYKYFNMDQAIRNALNYFDKHFCETKVIKKERLTLIIARYNESVAWINRIVDNKKIEKIIIFNKGNRLRSFLNKKVEIIPLYNSGREGDTYLHYIMKYYDKFPENLMFIQADPFEHNEYFLKYLDEDNIDKYIHRDYLNLSLCFKYNIEDYLKYKYFKLLDLTTAFNLSDELRVIDYVVNTRNQYFVGSHPFWDTKNENFKLFFEDTGESNIGEFLSNKLGIEPPKKYHKISMSSCFFIKSSLIKSNSLEVYKKLREFLYSKSMDGGVQGYILEKFWYYLFTKDSHDTLFDCYKDLFLGQKTVSVYDEKKKEVNIIEVNDNLEIVNKEHSYLIFENKKCLPQISIKGTVLETKPVKSLDSLIYDNKKIIKIFDKSNLICEYKYLEDCDKIVKSDNKCIIYSEYNILYGYEYTGDSFKTETAQAFENCIFDKDHIIKIYCKTRKQLWHKRLGDCTSIKPASSCIIYFSHNFILDGYDYEGPNLYM